MSFSVQELEFIQAVAYYLFTGVLVAILYGYIHYLYRSKTAKDRDYELYASVVLHDEVCTNKIKTNEVGQ